MPRYFFDTDDGTTAVCDTNGLELGGVGEARTEAVKVLPAIARDVMADGDERAVAVVVRGADGASIFRATLTLRCDWLTQLQGPD